MPRYWFLVALLCLVGSTALAQDAVKIDPQHNQVLFENDRVRVLKSWDNPGDKEPTHSHPDYLVYAIGPFKRRFTFSDGKTTEAEMQAGQVIWQPAQTHSGENIGASRTELLLIELKDPSATQQPATKKPELRVQNEAIVPQLHEHIPPEMPPSVLTKPAERVDLSGLWIANGYACPAFAVVSSEQIRIAHVGNVVTATKEKGDDCIRSGEITFIGNYDGNEVPAEVSAKVNLAPGPNTTLRHYGDALLEIASEDLLKLRIYGVARITLHRVK